MHSVWDAVGGEVALGLRLEKEVGYAREANWALASWGVETVRKHLVL